MTQEERNLLLKDLCARIPYLVKVNITNRESKNRIVELTEDNICHLTDNWWNKCKPYLFPISNITKEQKEDMIKSSCGIGSDKNVFDWFNKNHIDYRGLIPMGLAIDATGLNIY